LATAGDPDIKKEKLLKGHSIMGRNYKVHLDGYSLLPNWKGAVKKSPRKEFLYWTDPLQLSELLRFHTTCPP
jgi:arylsulfatase